jgi:hypothetical protein
VALRLITSGHGSLADYPTSSTLLMAHCLPKSSRIRFPLCVSQNLTFLENTLQRNFMSKSLRNGPLLVSLEQPEFTVNSKSFENKIKKTV